MNDDAIQDLCREYALASIELHEASRAFMRFAGQTRPAEIADAFSRASERKVAAFRAIANQLRKVK